MKVYDYAVSMHHKIIISLPGGPNSRKTFQRPQGCSDKCRLQSKHETARYVYLFVQQHTMFIYSFARDEVASFLNISLGQELFFCVSHIIDDIVTKARHYV